MVVRRIGRTRTAVVAAIVTAVIATGVAIGSATPSSGSLTTVIGRATVSDNIKINTKAIKLHAKEPFDIITQTVTFQPGGTSGWHSHPGPVFVIVKTGTVTVYDASCQPRRYTAGQGFLEGPEPAVVRNEGPTVSENVATLLVPVGQPARTEAPSLCPGIL